MTLTRRLGVILALAVAHHVLWMVLALASFGNAMRQFLAEGTSAPPTSTTERICDAIADFLGFPAVQILETYHLWTSGLAPVLWFGNSFVWAVLIFVTAGFIFERRAKAMQAA